MRFFRILLSFLLVLSCCIPCTPQAADPLDRVTFFGDSTTAHLAIRGGIPESRVWSGAAKTVLFETVNRIRCVHLAKEGRDLTLADAAALKKPSVLVITVGVSGGAGVLPRERFMETYRELLRSVRKASPDTKLLVQSILPLSDRSVRHYKHLTKEAVVQANGWIREVCREMDVPYLDTHAILIDPSTGYLKREYQNDEYMHLTASAYDAVLSHIRNKIIQLGY